MKVLRAALLALTGFFAMVAYDVIAMLYQHHYHPPMRDMLGFGLYVQFLGLAMVILIPLSIGLGELWWRDRKRYIPQIILLAATAFVPMTLTALSIHPYRTALFLFCVFASLPLRWSIERFTRQKLS